MIADRYIQQCLAEANQPTIRLGATGAPVIRWQRLLTEATGQACPRLGTFDVVTATATRAYQRQLGVGADGVVGARTWQAAMMRHCKRGTRAPALSTKDARSQAGLGDGMIPALSWTSVLLGAALGAASVLLLKK